MQFKLTVTLYILTISSMILFNSGCNGIKSGEASFGSLNITPPAPPPEPEPSGPDGASDGLQSDDYFYVGVETTNDAIAHVRSATGFLDACAVSKDATSNEDITCIIDVPEADLYAKPLEIKHNVPSGGMCRYLVRYPYYFYNQEIGVGPEVLEATTTVSRNASGDVTGVAHNCTVDSVPYPGCTGIPEINATLSLSGVNFACTYDKSSSGKANCCSGAFDVTKTFIDGTTTVTTSSGVWGPEEFSNACYGGWGKNNPLKSDAGASVGPLAGIIEFAKNGLQQVHKITPPAQLSKIPPSNRANMHVANFYGNIADWPSITGAADHTHVGYVLTAVPDNRTRKPYFIAPVDDLNGTPIESTSDSYEFLCLDEAYEIKHRIRVYVRDWDVYSDYLAYIASEGAVQAPDRPATDMEPGGCTGIGDQPCNDKADLDDFLNLLVPDILAAPTYDTVDPTKRTSYFPLINY